MVTDKAHLETSIAPSSRYDGLDALKTLCAFMVVCIHTPFPGVAGEYFASVCRMAVPVFLMITGFFYADVVRRGRERGQIGKIFKLLLVSNVVFFVARLLQYHSSLGEYLSSLLSADVWVNFLIFNEPPFAGHLWYLGAVLYALVVVFALSRLMPGRWRTVLYALTVPLLACDLVLGKYSLALLGQPFPPYIARNFLFVGIPYFSIGLFLRHHLPALSRLQKHKALVLCMVLFALTTLLERYVLVSAGLNAERDHYISTTFLAISAFIFCSNVRWNDGKVPLIKEIGRKHSTFIYLYHPIIMTVLASAVGASPLATAYGLVSPFVVFALTALISYFFAAMKKKFGKNGSGGQGPRKEHDERIPGSRRADEEIV